MFQTFYDEQFALKMQKFKREVHKVNPLEI